MLACASKYSYIDLDTSMVTTVPAYVPKSNQYCFIYMKHKVLGAETLAYTSFQQS